MRTGKKHNTTDSAAKGSPKTAKKGVIISMPADFIEQELLNLPADIAWEAYKTLNAVFAALPAWQQYHLKLRQKLLDKMNRIDNPVPHITMQNPRIEGPLYGISNNDVVNLGTQKKHL